MSHRDGVPQSGASPREAQAYAQKTEAKDEADPAPSFEQVRTLAIPQGQCGENHATQKASDTDHDQEIFEQAVNSHGSYIGETSEFAKRFLQQEYGYTQYSHY
ncbi:hypothetical protein ACFQE0_24770 [Methylobacterium komagatae]|uniref:Uncharacterized protein n=1 Tax=Methylobacterium komagatae TaxID=374425 RepID=A0ABW2BPX8_9HYPH